MTQTETPKFGTSGLRGLVTGLTPALIARHVAGFVNVCDTGGTVLIAEDLRSSSAEIAANAASAVQAAGAVPVRLGALPTPALALAAQKANAGAIMVTGSHIPADRNGLKFYTRGGMEITKSDEAAIVDAAQTPPPPLTPAAGIDGRASETASNAYAARYVDAFDNALSGLKLGLYAHSSVARDTLADILTRMGAEVTELARSDSFVPVDTEAVSQETRALLDDWAGQGFDAILSTDGDADRPLLTDASGRIIPGDTLGAITAVYLGASHVVTPVTSNTMLERMDFTAIARTRIGSPFVIAEMMTLADQNVVGFEANGGFLLGFDARGLSALPTRDAVLPLIAPLMAAKAKGQTLAELVAGLPDRVTAADRLQEVDRPVAEAWIDRLKTDPEARAAFWDGETVDLDLTDGVRMVSPRGDILHLRMSGNAPELRIYAEAESEDAAARLLQNGISRASDTLIVDP